MQVRRVFVQVTEILGSQNISGFMNTLKVVVFLILGLMFTESGWGTDLRGRIEAKHRYAEKSFPVNNAMVVLKSAEDGARVVARTWTGQSGYYYFRGIDAGEYELQVMKYKDKELARYRVTVGDMKRQTIQPILLDQEQ